MTEIIDQAQFSISIIIPIFNEEGNIIPLVSRINTILKDCPQFKIIFVDDGSTDSSLKMIKEITNKNIHFISFSRNFGHQNALRAGLDLTDTDCVITLDGDLQHPPEIIPQMLAKWKEGFEVVYTIRSDDPNISFFKKISSKLFYKILTIMTDIDIEAGTADFRLLDKKVVNVLKNIRENDLFLRGLVKWVGFKQTSIIYNSDERFTGDTKYTFKKMFSFSLSGIMSFSSKPLYFSIYIGILMAFFSFGYACYALYIKFFTTRAVDGWTSLLIIISLLGGIQLITVGIIGKYLGMLFIEQKKRPNYIIRENSLTSR